MRHCACQHPHAVSRVVLTGGPGAGKTAVLEIVRQILCQHVRVLPEAASVIFGGGFPRGDVARMRDAAQRAIFYVQRELENATEALNPAVILCDRGTLDGAAYATNAEEFFRTVGTSRVEQIARYSAVIHLRTPSAAQGYNHQNPLRIEAPEDAAAIDDRIALAWASHPRVIVVESAADFMKKAAQAVAAIRDEVPECCRAHFDGIATGRVR